MSNLLAAWMRAAAVFAALFSGAMSGTAGEGSGRQIVYLSNREGISRAFDIVLHDVETGKEVNLTRGQTNPGITSMSAPRLLRSRGSVVAFGSRGKALVEVPLGGGPVRTVATIVQGVGGISIAPDDGSLLFVDRIGGKYQIVEADLRTRETRTLTKNPWNSTEPCYSPDGRSIAYVTDQDSSSSIGLMARDGSGQKVLTNNFGDDRYPCFTPSGDRILFSSSRSATIEGQFDLYAIDISGRRFDLLYANSAYNAYPSVSPDGKDVVFVSSNLPKKLSRILLFNLADRKVVNLSGDLPLLSSNASFSPDGSAVVFEHTTIRDCEVMLYDREKKSLENISQNKGWDCSPSF